MLRAVQTGPVIGLLGQLVVLPSCPAPLDGRRRLDGGTACGLITVAGLMHGLNRSGRGVLGAANRVTLARATLVGAVAALVADALLGPADVAAVAGLAVVALVLDGMDGWVAGALERCQCWVRASTWRSTRS